MYRLLLPNRARKDLDRLMGASWERVRDAVLGLRDDPRPEGCKKLRGGPHALRLRIRDYRVAYDLDDDAKTVTLLRIRHRREAYRDL